MLQDWQEISGRDLNNLEERKFFLCHFTVVSKRIPRQSFSEFRIVFVPDCILDLTLQQEHRKHDQRNHMLEDVKRRHSPKGEGMGGTMCYAHIRLASVRLLTVIWQLRKYSTGLSDSDGSRPAAVSISRSFSSAARNVGISAGKPVLRSSHTCAQKYSNIARQLSFVEKKG